MLGDPRSLFTPMVKYRRPACARPPPGAAGGGRRRRVGDELEHAAAQRVAPLGTAVELDPPCGTSARKPS